MELTYACRRCGAIGRAADVREGTRLVCPSCSDEQTVAASTFDAEGLRSCAYCATDDLYIQKDFPQRLGIAIVLIGFAISSVFWYLERPLATYAILLASALLDMLLFYRVPDVTICYRCLAQHRGPGSNPSRRFLYFDLAIGERYRQERLRVEELRREGRSTPDAPGGPPL